MSSFGHQDFRGGQQRAMAHQLYIDTPEQVELQFAVAGMGSRFVALLLDHIIQWGTMVVVVVILGLVLAASGAHAASDMGEMNTAGKWMLAIFIFLIFLMQWGYFALFEAYWHGQTPGKRVMKLRVIKDSGRQITFFEALARNLIRFIDYLPGLYLAGAITMLCNKQNKRLGDLAAGTLVVHEHRDEPLMVVHEGGTFTPAGEVEWRNPAGPGMFPADAVARLKTSDLAVIDTFFGRALDLNVDVRAAMAERVAKQMAAKMGVSLPEGNPERALEAIAIAMRGRARSF
jgi:uncharacterized RDD family membrane protein YckC